MQLRKEMRDELERMKTQYLFKVITDVSQYISILIVTSAVAT